MEKVKKSDSPWQVKYNNLSQEKGTLSVFLESNLALI